MSDFDGDYYIRKMNEGDITSIIAIDKKISTPEDKINTTLENELLYYLNKQENICLVVEIQERVVGFMIGAIHQWLFGINNAGWIEILGVDPSHTGKGVGKKLAEVLFDEFRSTGIKIVHTAVDWTSGDLLEFFRTLGMTQSGFISLMKEL
ncbi:MAG: GNAT family N-acetyltransferase [Candidatus Kariarchaeaceae archaeon]|jgi:GNAT superfamily N-acetyltransferase